MFVVIRFVSLINLFKVLGFVRSYPSYAYHVIERYTQRTHNVHHTTHTQRTPYVHPTPAHRTHTRHSTVPTHACTPYTNAIHTVHQRLHTPIPTIHTRHSLPIGHAIARYTLTDTHRTHIRPHTPHPNAYPVGHDP